MAAQSLEPNGCRVRILYVHEMVPMDGRNRSRRMFASRRIQRRSCPLDDACRHGCAACDDHGWSYCRVMVLLIVNPACLRDIPVEGQTKHGKLEARVVATYWKQVDLEGVVYMYS